MAPFTSIERNRCARNAGEKCSAAQPCLELQRHQEVSWVGELFPHARQEQRALALVLDDQAVDARPQLSQQIGLTVEVHRDGRSQHRDR